MNSKVLAKFAVATLGAGFMVAGLMVCAALAAAAETGQEPWWPQFHGPNRDNIARETGLLKQWPDGGPPLVWKYADCGRGYSMVAIAKGMIFTAGDFGAEEWLLALDMHGKLLWKSPNGASWKGAYPGSRTTPTFVEGVLYHLNPNGRLAAFRADSGKPLWSVDLRAEFDARHGTWAMAENLAVEGDRVFCTPGGKKALIAALDKQTGKTLWTNTDLDETAAYCSPIIVTHNGVRQLMTVTQKSLVSVDVSSGKLLWSYPHPTKNDQNVNQPIFHEGYVFVASGHGTGGTLLRINPDCRGVTKIWARKEIDNCHPGVIHLGGCLYGSACRSGGKAFFCADFLTGELKHRDATLGRVSLTGADGMLYGINDRGKLLLLAASPDGFKVVSQFQVSKEGDDLYLSQPVVCGGRLYLRHHGNLYVYDVSAK